MDASHREAPEASPSSLSDSDVSPMTQAAGHREGASTGAIMERLPIPAAGPTDKDYFPPEAPQAAATTTDANQVRHSQTPVVSTQNMASTTLDGANENDSGTPDGTAAASKRVATDAATTMATLVGTATASSTSTTNTSGRIQWSVNGAPPLLDLSGLDGPGSNSRKSSYASVSFCQNQNPSLPQGTPKQARIRSPAPTRFRKHVGFDNIPLGEATKSNTLGYTLSVSHYGYHPRRRSRTMMVGIDQNVWSDFALQWLLDEYADDGDEVICVHVIDKDARTVEVKNYKVKADQMVERIKRKIPEHCAISVTLEYAVGKLHDTFQKLIQVYHPSMLVVGTRGRSLGGFQGLVNTSSFSKYCLQYSPIPTVVVRDNEKRIKKKEKRSADPTRHSYAAMLAATNGVHEANSETSSLYDMEARLSPDEEAHRVAAAIGLPAAFDPTLKPMDIDQYLGRRSRTSSPSGGTIGRSPVDAAAKSPLSTTEKAATLSVDSEDEDSGDDEGEFEVTSGQALQAATAEATESRKEKQKRLHLMEVGEAAALKQTVESDEEEDEEEEEEEGREGKTEPAGAETAGMETAGTETADGGKDEAAASKEQNANDEKETGDTKAET